MHIVYSIKCFGAFSNIFQIFKFKSTIVLTHVPSSSHLDRFLRSHIFSKFMQSLSLKNLLFFQLFLALSYQIEDVDIKYFLAINFEAILPINNETISYVLEMIEAFGMRKFLSCDFVFDLSMIMKLLAFSRMEHGCIIYIIGGSNYIISRRFFGDSCPSYYFQLAW